MDEVTADVPEMVPQDVPVEPEIVPEVAPEAPVEPVVEPEVVPEAPVEPVPEAPVLSPEAETAIADAIPDPVVPEDPAVEVIAHAAEAVAAHPERHDMGKVFEQNGTKYVRTTDETGQIVDIALPTVG